MILKPSNHGAGDMAGNPSAPTPGRAETPGNTENPKTPVPPTAPAPTAPARTEGNSSGGATSTKAVPVKSPPRMLPPWKVLLHNDDTNAFEYVVETVRMIARLGKQDAELRTKEAHEAGVALLLTTHQERAELIQQQFASRNLTVTIEPAEK